MRPLPKDRPSAAIASLVQPGVRAAISVTTARPAVTNLLVRVLSRAIATATRRYVKFCLGTSSFKITPDSECVLRATWDADVPTVFVYWHDEFILNVLLPLHWGSGNSRGTMPACAANDAFGGHVIRECLVILGVPVMTLSRGGSRPDKLVELRKALVKHRRLLLSADYGRPWFKARPTAFQVASADGRVVAMHIAAAREWIIRLGTWRLRLPLPFNRYVLRLADVSDARANRRSSLAEKLGAELHSLRHAIQAD